MSFRIVPVLASALYVYAGFASAADTNADKDVQQGRRLAIIVCANCHVVASDQPYEPILRPPAPSFQAIAQGNTANADALRRYLTTLHLKVSHPEDMPNPQLIDSQMKQVIAYLLSLRKQP